MRGYELMLVLDPTLDDSGVNGMIERISGAIGTAEGEVLFAGQLADRKGNVSEVENGEGWRKRRLAYPIEKKTEGYYVVLRFNTPTSFIAQVERTLNLDESVLRYMTTRLEED